jgi:hypothetical protein
MQAIVPGMSLGSQKRLELEQGLLAGLLLPTWEIAEPIPLRKIDEWASGGWCLRHFCRENEPIDGNRLERIFSRIFIGQ